jgi:hypothetical protein
LTVDGTNKVMRCNLTAMFLALVTRDDALRVAAAVLVGGGNDKC